MLVAEFFERDYSGEESRGMLLAASNVPKDAAVDMPRRVVVLSPSSEIAPGSIVS